ncbi:AAA family ATPase [Kitasatospora sp. CB01950]|uniref:AAA family ATPase n=1 Tax=Kitasatospora sp. CB01950 TaxID=1703930 RepID=UPI00093E1B2A|nr:AAA family ATPase [Kitasatospora sp. CB01950]OKJ06807.1 hypothetical protein AMK19_23415 [Kitasatospora sp. CB01950]
MSNVHPFPAPPEPEDDGEYIDRRVPEDQAAEMAVLRACMYDRNNVPRAAQLLRGADFYRPAHELIWNVLQEQHRSDGPTDPIAVNREIIALGQGHRVNGGYLFTITDTAAFGEVEYYAGIVAEQAAARRADNLAVRIKTAIARGARPDDLNTLIAEHVAAEETRTAAAAGGGPTHLLASTLDWDALFGTNYQNVQLLPGQLLAHGQQIAMVAEGKAGKSLLAEEWAWRMGTGRPFLGDRAQPPIRVTYVDAENGHPEIQQRFRSFGASPDDMGLLTYLSFPPVRPLDTPGGGQDLMAIATATQAQVVFIDTVSRFISGAENDADTWLNLYRHTLMPLKAAGIASIRLDHMGKDGERGARGSSAKTQDVDHVWELRAQGGGILSLKRTHSRTGVGPDEFTVIRHSRKAGTDWVFGATRHDLMTWEDRAALIEGTTEWLVDQLDRAGVDPTWGSPKVINWCREKGIRVRKDKAEEAVRVRKSRPSGDIPPHLPYSPVTETPPDTGGGNDKTAGQTSPGEVGGRFGGPHSAPPSPRLPPIEGGGGSAPGEDIPICTLCGDPLQLDWAARGYTTHVICQPTHDTP